METLFRPGTQVDTDDSYPFHRMADIISGLQKLQQQNQEHPARPQGRKINPESFPIVLADAQTLIDIVAIANVYYMTVRGTNHETPELRKALAVFDSVHSLNDKTSTLMDVWNLLPEGQIKTAVGYLILNRNEPTRAHNATAVEKPKIQPKRHFLRWRF